MEKAVGVCCSDCVHSLTAKQIIYFSYNREISHISTHKATGPNNSNVVTGSVFGDLYEERKL